MAVVRGELSPTATAAVADAIPHKLRRGGGSPRQVFALVLIGAIVLALFASRDLSSWLNRLGGGPILSPLQHAATEWDETMTTLGLVLPHEELRSTIGRLLDWEWPGRQ